MGTIAIVISYTVITSYQFKGGGDILHLIFPDSISRDQGMCIIAAFVILFTAAAGMASIAYLDLVIGAMGPPAPPAMCNGVVIPIVFFDQIVSMLKVKYTSNPFLKKPPCCQRKTFFAVC